MAIETVYADATLDAGACVTPENAHGAFDGTYTGNTGNTNWTARWSIANPVDPLTSGITHTVTLRIQKDAAGGNAPSYSVDLYRAGTLVKTIIASATLESDIPTDISGTFTTAEFGSDPTDLEILVDVVGSGGPTNSRRNVQVDGIEAEVDTSPVVAEDYTREITDDSGAVDSGSFEQGREDSAGIIDDIVVSHTVGGGTGTDHNQTITDISDVEDVGSWEHGSNTDPVGATDFITVDHQTAIGTNHTREVIDSADAVDNTETISFGYEVDLVDGADASDEGSWQLDGGVDSAGATDSITIDHQIAVGTDYAREITDTGDGTDSVDRFVSLNIIITDSSDATDDIAKATEFNLTLSDGANAEDDIAKATEFNLTLSDGAEAQDSTEAAHTAPGFEAQTVVDTSGASDSISSVATYGRSADDGAGAADSIEVTHSRVIEVSIVDSATAIDSVEAAHSGVIEVTITDGATATDSIATVHTVPGGITHTLDISISIAAAKLRAAFEPGAGTLRPPSIEGAVDRLTANSTSESWDVGEALTLYPTTINEPTTAWEVEEHSSRWLIGAATIDR